MITILSYNIEFGKKLNDIHKWINKLEKKPEIICFQEFPEYKVSNLEKNKLFKNQTICFAKGLTSGGKYYGELTVFDNSKIKFKNNIYLDFRANGIENLFRKRKIKRSAIITTFQKDDIEFDLANVHLTPLSFHGLRKRQLHQVIKNVKIKRAIILGDFNYSSLLNSGGLITFMNKYNYEVAGEKLITNKYKYKISQQLDYIFYKNLKIENIKVLELPYSDHFPILADLDI